MSIAQQQHHTSEKQPSLHALPQRLLAIQATDVKRALDQASQLVLEACDAEKVDVFLYDATTDTLVAMGSSNTPLTEKQQEHGLDRLPIANGGRQVEVFLTGKPYRTGAAEQDHTVLSGMREILGVRSMLVVPLDIDGQRRGILSVTSKQPDEFPPEYLPVIEATAQWIGLVAHRAELVERIAFDAAEQARRGLAEELIATLSHDLRNMIAPISGRVDLIRRQATREGQEKYVRHAEEAGAAIRRMQTLVQDLLDVSRLEQGHLTLIRDHVNLSTLAQEAIAEQPSTTLDIQFTGADEVCTDGDPARIRQAIDTLLLNAIKHAPDDTPIIVNSSTVEDVAGKQWAALEVHDQGPPIDPTVLPHIFDRFTSGRGSSGLGLGLYLMHGIATIHGGRVEVTSSAESGTRFRMVLPGCADQHDN